MASSSQLGARRRRWRRRCGFRARRLHQRGGSRSRRGRPGLAV